MIPTIEEKLSDYRAFLESKIIQTPPTGFEVPKESISEILFPYQRDIVQWSLEGGRRAIFATFGRGKTIMQLEIAQQVVKYTGKPFLIGLPLTVAMEFEADAELLGVKVKYVLDQQDVEKSLQQEPECRVFMSNYERIRTGKFDPDMFGGVSFDEGDAIRNLDTETTDYIMNNFDRVPYRFIATATPSPNDYTELLNYAQFLGVMDRSQALTRFFQRDSTKANNLTLYPHKVKEFWLWVRSWSIFCKSPSDLGYPDDGMELPKLNIHYHRISVTERGTTADRDGQMKLTRNSSKGLQDAAKEKRESISARVAKATEIIKADDPELHWLIWHHQENERKAISEALPEAKSVWGSQNTDQREQSLLGFKNGQFKYLSTKPEIAGSGCNFQKHCYNAVFVGIDYRFKDFIQAIHRIYRFLQTNDVNIHIIYTDAEDEVLKVLQRKWSEHNELEEQMTHIMRTYGLSSATITADLKRSIGVQRKSESGQGWEAIHNDSVIELIGWADNCVDMYGMSDPFSDQYEYCESYNDMGHNDGNGEYFKQRAFLTREMFRTLKPGRVACIHVKDRIRFSYQNGEAFTSLIDFSGQTVKHFEEHGFHLMAKRTIATDVVFENNQTYRLGYTEMCKDATSKGCGSPEYLLVFRKPQTDKSNGRADEPVTKDQNRYTLANWQLDADAIWRSSGNRALKVDEMNSMSHKVLKSLWKQECETEIYDHARHIEIAQKLLDNDRLPKTFMLLPALSNSEHIWHDISRMHTLNASQALRKKEKHICPLQFDILDRMITLYSNEGDLVVDPFGGISSLNYRAIPLKRRCKTIELNEGYWQDGVWYSRKAEALESVPTLFGALEIGKETAA